VVEGGGVEVGGDPVAWQREPAHPQRAVIDAHDRVQSAVGDPRRAVRPDDHAVGGRAGAERHAPGPRVEAPQLARRLSREPHSAVVRPRHVVRPGSIEHPVLAQLHARRARAAGDTRPLVRLDRGDDLEVVRRAGGRDDHRRAFGDAHRRSVVDREAVRQQHRIRTAAGRRREQSPQACRLALAGERTGQIAGRQEGRLPSPAVRLATTSPTGIRSRLSALPIARDWRRPSAFTLRCRAQSRRSRGSRVSSVIEKSVAAWRKRST
jgi:hypothetical protein